MGMIDSEILIKQLKDALEAYENAGDPLRTFGLLAAIDIAEELGKRQEEKKEEKKKEEKTEKVFVVGRMEGKEWTPCLKTDACLRSGAVCRTASLSNGKITPLKEPVVLDADLCFYAKSARKAKIMYSDFFSGIAEKEEKINPEAEAKNEAPLSAVAYTDGSYNKETGRYGYGIVMEIGDLTEEYYGGDYDTTGGWQVNGELEGALIAIEEAIRAGCKKLEIRYDYEGVRMWADGLWKAKKDYTAEYKRAVAEYRKQISVSFTHIKSHTGNSGNDRADFLAKWGAGLLPTPEAGEKESESAGKDLDGIGEFVNLSCRNALITFKRKPKPAFKDFMQLKTGGLDYYSRLKEDDLREYAEKNRFDPSAELKDTKSQLTAIRWMMRGLSAEDAVHKVKVDAEVSENAKDSRKNRW